MAATASMFQLPEVFRPSVGRTSDSAPTQVQRRNNSSASRKIPPALPARPANKVRKSETDTQTNKKKSFVDSFTFSFGSLVPKPVESTTQNSFVQSNPTKLPTPAGSRKNTLEPILPQHSISSDSGIRKLQRRASSIGQTVSKQASMLVSSTKKKSSLIEQPAGSTRDWTAPQNSGSSRDLASRLSFARVASDRGLAKPRKSESIFTKQELKAIRRAATEANTVQWDGDESRTSDDTSIISGNDDDPRKNMGPSEVDVDSLFKSRKGSFEMGNPTLQFGLLVFKGQASTVIELEED